MPKVAMVLCGCGVFDGSEIHESVLTWLALDRAGAETILVAPFGEQAQVINHQSGENVSHETRRIEVEAARIARGKVMDLAQLQAKDIQAIIFPGGFGVAKNLCTYAFDGPKLKIHPEVARITLEMVRNKKPIGTLCIAPVMTAKILADAGYKVTVTIGKDEKTAADIQSFGAIHQPCTVEDIIIDKNLGVVSTPAYMLAHSITEASIGIEKLVSAVLKLCQ